MYPARSKYSILLYTSGGFQLADLSRLAHDRSIELARNVADIIDFRLNLREFESFAANIGSTAADLLHEGQTEVRVYRGKALLAGGRIRTAPVTLVSDQISVHATGFLDDFARRYTGTWPSGHVQESFTTWSKAGIVGELVRQSQALTNGNLGISIDATQQYFGSNQIKTYDYSNIKQAIIELTQDSDEPLDVIITGDKQVRTYNAIGSQKRTLSFIYPGGNIKDIQMPNDVTRTINEVRALGAGTVGGTQDIATSVDSDSQADYFLLQDLYSASPAASDTAAIQDEADRYIATYKDALRLPTLVVDGNVAPFLGEYGIGDYVIVSVDPALSMFRDVSGYQRIEHIKVSIDDKDSETVEINVTNQATAANRSSDMPGQRLPRMVANLQRDIRKSRTTA